MKRIIPLFYVFLLFYACQNSQGPFDVMTQEDSMPYLASHTSGGILVNDIQVIKFLKDVDHQEAELQKLFYSKPSANWEVHWTSPRELHLQPLTPLKADQSYSMHLNLGRLFDDLATKQQYVYTVFTLKKEVKYSQGTFISPGAGNELIFKGHLNYWGMDREELKPAWVEVQLEGETLPLEWDTPETNAWSFQTSMINKKSQVQELLVRVKELDSGDWIEYSYEVPVKDKLTVVDVFSNNIGDQPIKIVFSSTLDKNQDLSGLISLGGSDSFRSVIQRNELLIYPTMNSFQTNLAKLIIYEGIRDINGMRLDKQVHKDVNLGDVNPEIKLLHSDGQILPNPNEASISFEAVNLKSVIVIVKRIHEHNVMQHLQVNRINENWELNRVGEIIAIDRIPLKLTATTSRNKWEKFQVDLSPYITEEQGALYDVTIGFNKRDGLMACDDESPGSVSSVSMERDLKSWYNEGYDWSNYDYRQRDNPCHSSYYNRNRWVSQMLLASPFAITAKLGQTEGLSIFVSDIETAAPIEQVDVTIYNYQQRELFSNRTNPEGRADFIVGQEEPYFVKVEGRKNRGILVLDPSRTLALSPFDVDGYEFNGSGKGFIYTERGVWRPGDTVFLDFILHQGRNKGPANQPVICDVYNPEGKLMHRFVKNKSLNGFYDFPFVLDPESLTGNWNAQISVGGAVLNKTLPVETIKPNRLQVKVDVPNAIDYQPDNFGVPLEVQWLTGAPAGGGKVDVDVYMKEQAIEFGRWNDFDFGQVGSLWKSDRQRVFEGRTNGKGQAEFDLDFTSIRQSSGPVEVLINGKAYEPSGEFSIFQKRTLTYPHPVFVGIKTNKTRWNSLDVSQEQQAEIVVVDAEGNPLAGRKLDIYIQLSNRRYWWDQSSRRPVYKTGEDQSVLTRAQIVSSGAPVKWDIPIEDLARSGYIIWVQDAESGQLASTFFYPTSYSWYDSDDRKGPQIVEVELEDDRVEVGDKVEVRIPSSEGSRVLLSIESGNKMIQSAWSNTRKDQTVLSFTATREMIPNAYVYVSLIHPYEKTLSGRPIRSFSVESFEVTEASSIIEPQLKMPLEANPETELKIEVSEKSGRAMTYTLALVDEGLLGLTNFSTPDPNSVFLAKQALGIKTWDNYDQIIGAYADGGRLLAIGGDEGINSESLNEMNRFKPVVRHLGPFQMKKNGRSEHRIKLPSYIGNLRVMLVAGDGHAFGHATENVLVREELMVLGTVPRTLSPGDVFELPVTAFSMIEASMNVDISIKVEGNLEIQGQPSGKIKLAGNSNETKSFKLRASDREGQGKISIIARSGKFEASHIVDVQIQSQSDYLTTVYDTILEAQGVLDWVYEPLGMEGSNSGVLEFSTFPAMNLNQRTSYLLRYPYGCTEQTASAVWGQLHLSDLTSLNEGQKKQNMFFIQEGINRLSNRQLSGGGMSYWPGDNLTSPWVSVQIAQIILDAEKKGIQINSNFKEPLFHYLHEACEQWNPKGYREDELIQSYRLMVLAENGTPVLGPMNRMKTRNFSSAPAKAALALAYTYAGYEDVGRSLMQALGDLPITSADYAYRYNADPIIGKALLVQAYMKLGETSLAAKLAAEMASALGSEKVLNTQAIGWGLKGVSSYLSQTNADNDVDIEMMDLSKTQRLTGDAVVINYTLPSPDQSRSLNITSKGNAPVFVRVIREGRPKRHISVEEEWNGLEVYTEYRDLEGHVIDISSIKKGMTFTSVIKVRLTDERYQHDVAIDHPVPAGWELVNSRFEGTADSQGGRLNHLDIRDDRIIYHADLTSSFQEYRCDFIATYTGSYYKAPLRIEAMYSDEIHGHETSDIIEVTGK